MAAKEYGSVAGFIQFPVESRDLDSGQTVRDATVRSLATGDLVRITLWEDFAEVDVDKGDFLAADGQMTTREHNGKLYVNCSPFTVAYGLNTVTSSPPEAKEKPAPEKKRTF